ncbi:MAG: ferritin-like domain-containing protein [Methylocapsa sp.]|nr:ferritin-like domain-containing protein [Methylocapsa sp.]
MSLFSKDMRTIDDLFLYHLGGMYYAEQQILDALPRMIAKTASPELKSAFERHVEETRNHVLRIERVFDMYDAQPKAVSSAAINGIIKEANEIAEEISEREVLDAALIGAAQTVEHFEIAHYGTLIAWLRQLGRDGCASVLEMNLQEEKAADQQLTELAESKINAGAVFSA